LQKVEGYGERRNPPGEAIARVNLAYIYCGRKELGLAREQANTAGLLVPGINLFMPELASKIALFIHDVNGLGKLEGLFLSVAGEAFD